MWKRSEQKFFKNLKFIAETFFHEIDTVKVSIYGYGCRKKFNTTQNYKMLTYVETRLRTNVGALSCYFNQW